MEREAIHAKAQEFLAAAPADAAPLQKLVDVARQLIGFVIATAGTLTPEAKAQIESVLLSIFDNLVVLPEPLDSISDSIAKMVVEKLLSVGA